MAVPKECKCISAGIWASISIESFVTKLDTKVSKAQNVTDDKRNAAFNEQGHQKTPAFILCLIQDVLNEDMSSGSLVNSSPRGGFTDVGLHTGITARDTSWVLTRAVMKQYP